MCEYFGNVDVFVFNLEGLGGGVLGFFGCLGCEVLGVFGEEIIGECVEVWCGGCVVYFLFLVFFMKMKFMI